MAAVTSLLCLPGGPARLRAYHVLFDDEEEEEEEELL